jgi:glucose-1-phosphate cytidylyltransferase
LQISQNGNVEKFAEKPPSDDWVNGGFFIFQNEIFEFLDDEIVLEQNPLINLAKKGELHAYKHTGWWKPMDTYREAKELNDLYRSGRAPWRNWQ